ncbi:hypothetical protein KAR10_01530 [bacterium]|nr:hypothetical protein [bacterium]
MNKKYQDLVIGFFVSAGFIVVYKLCQYILLPGVNTSYSAWYPGSTFSIVAQGIVPIISAFLITEIASFFVPPLKKMRLDSFRGRAKLNKIALATTIILTIINGIGLLKALGKAGLGMQCTWMLIWIVSTLAIWLLIDKVVNRWGLGNGFSVLVAFHLAEQVLAGSYTYLVIMFNNFMNFNHIPFLLLAAWVFIVFKFLYKQHTITVKLKEHDLNFPIYVLPQGTQGFTAVNSSLMYLITIFFYLGFPNLESLGWQDNLCFAILILPVALVYMYFFTYSARIRNNLPGIIFDESKYNKQLLLNLLLSSGVLTASQIGLFYFYQYYRSIIPPGISVIEIIFLAAISIDYFHKIRAMLRYEHLTRLCSLDNVHLASLLKSAFKQADIKHVIQGYNHRTLGFFFLPHIKMDIFVARQDIDGAKAVWDEVAPRIV